MKLVYAVDFNDYLKQFAPIDLIVIGVSFGVILILICCVVIFYFYRKKRIKTHTIHIILDGGIYQGSSKDLLLTAKTGTDIVLKDIVPSKDGYLFTGFNIYRRYVASTISQNGIKKQTIVSEILDGQDKSIFTVPNYDVYLIAKYSPVVDSSALELNSQVYYPSFLNVDDLLAEVKHFNYDRESYPDKINVYMDLKNPGFYYFFRNENIFMMFKEYKGLVKVYLRTSSPLEIFTDPFFQKEEINDAYEWYSFIVMYNTKLTRFINLASYAYNQISGKDVTSKVEMSLIIYSIVKYADPVLDRALLITKKYVSDLENNLVDELPNYVTNRQLIDFKNTSVENLKQVVDADGEIYNIEDELSEEEKEEIKIKKTPLKLSKDQLSNLISEKFNFVEVIKRKQTNQPYSFVQNGKVNLMIFENRFKLVRLVLKLSKDEYDEVKNQHSNISKAKFPVTGSWYNLYLDNSFVSEEELLNIVKKAFN